MDKEKMIVIGIGSRPGGDPIGKELEDAEEADSDMFEAMAPKGDFTSRGLAPLVRATNRLLPLFGQEPNYPSVPDTKVLPTDFTRILAMFKSAVDDAISKEIVDPEMAIMLDGVRDDSALMSMAGKLDMLSRDKEFKRFLKEPMEEEEGMGQEMGEEMGMSPEEEDNMMMERM